jgi:hypothetical protein
MPGADLNAITAAVGSKLFAAACSERAGDHPTAMRLLGEALHTSQDKWAHKYNRALPWGGTLRQHLGGLINEHWDPDNRDVNFENFKSAIYETTLVGKAFLRLKDMQLGRGCKPS